MSDINVSADFSELIDQTTKAYNLTNQQVEALKKYLQVTVQVEDKVDKLGNAYKKNTATITSQISEFQKLNAVIVDTGNGYEFVRGKVTQLNKDLDAEAAVSKRAAQAAKDHAIAERERASAIAKADAEAGRLEKRLNDLNAKNTASAAKQNRVTILDSVVRDQTQGERTRLQGLGTDISGSTQGQLLAISRSIAELGVKAGLTAKQLQDMFQKVNSGDLSGIESKYAGVVNGIVRYNSIIQAERDKLAKGMNTAAGNTGGRPPEIPSVSSQAIERGLQYVNILGRIQGTLTNLALYRGFNFFTKSITESIASAQQFERQVALIRTISQDANLSTGQWTTNLKILSNTLGVEFTDVATAAYDAVSAQLVQGQATFKYVSDIGQLAKVAGTDVKIAGESVQAVLNSYGLSADKAEEVSAKLFKTIDNGNIRLQDFAGTFGRVGALGQELGVSYEELLAILSTFTRNGVKTADAMVFLTNILTKLQQPTESMKLVFKDLGYASGESAVKINGLRDTLLKLIEAQQAGNVNAIDLFPEIRGEKGFALYKQNIKEADKDLDDIKNKSLAYFKNAKEIVGETDAQKIAETVQTFKNALATTVGRSFNKIVADTLTVRQGGETPEAFMERMEAAASRLFRTVAAGGATIAAFVVGMKTLAIASEIAAIRALRSAQMEAAETAARTRNIAVVNAESVATARLNAIKGGGIGAAAGANPLLAIGIGAASLLAGYQAYKNVAVDSFNATSEAVDELFRKLKSRDANKQLEEAVDLTKKLREEFDKAAKTFGKSLQEALAQNNIAIGDIREKIRLSQDSLKEGFVAAISLAEDKLADVKHRISEINSLLKGGALRTAEFGDKQRDAIYGTNQKFANPQQQLQLVEKEYARISNKIRELINQGTPEAFSEAEKLFDRKSQLQTQYYEKDAELRNTQFQENAKQQGLTGRQTFYYDDTQQQKSANNLMKERLVLQQKEKEILEARLAKERESEAIKKAEIDKTKNAIKAYEDFSVTDSQGNVRQNFRDNFGNLDPKKAMEEYKRIVQNLRDVIPADVSGRIGLKAETDKREALLTAQIIRESGGKQLSDAQRNVADGIANQSKALDEGQKKILQYEQSVKQLVAELQALNKAFSDTAKSTPENIIKDISGTGIAGDVRRNVIALAEALPNRGKSKKEAVKEAFDPIVKEAQEIDDLIKDLPNKIITRSGQRLTDPKAVSDILQRLETLREKMIAAGNVAVKQFDLKDATGGSLKLAGTENTLDKSIDVLKSFQERFSDSRVGVANALSDMDRAQARVAELTAMLKNVTDQFDQMNKSLAAAGAQGLNNSEAQLKKFQEIAKLAEDTAKRIRDAGVVGVQQPGTLVQPGAVPQAKFSGGPIYKAYGGPIGQDNVPVWAAHGEYVVNRAATSRYYSQISSMNSTARIPQYFNKGGPVTNMGGVTFNVNESKNPQVTAREIQRMLDRSRRMGNS